MRGRGRNGFTLVEVMVSLAVIGIAAGLIFGVQMRMTGALQDQQNVAEVQQTLRSAASVITKDLRQAGYLASVVYQQGSSLPADAIQPVQITNGASGAPDTLRLQSANDNCSAHVCDTNGTFCCIGKPNPPAPCGPSFNSAETQVDDSSCFKAGDLAYAVRTTTVGTPGTAGYVPVGTGCILYITLDPQSSSSGSIQKIQHHPVSPWNTPGNNQCDPLQTVWNDGYTMFMHIRLRSYRIKPDDARGVLQMCETGICAEADWQDVALGIVDMQFALRVCHDDATDHDQDGLKSPECANIDWFSGSDMATLATTVTNPRILMASVTLVAKTTKEVNGPKLSEVPSLMDPNWPTTAHPSNDADHNRLSDKGPVTLPVTDKTTWPSSMYNGDVVYRIFTTTVDLRNVSVGVAETHS